MAPDYGQAEAGECASGDALAKSEAGSHSHHEREQGADHARLGGVGIGQGQGLEDEVESGFADTHEEEQLPVAGLVLDMPEVFEDEQETEGGEEHAAKYHHHGVKVVEGDFEDDERAGPEDHRCPERRQRFSFPLHVRHECSLCLEGCSITEFQAWEQRKASFLVIGFIGNDDALGWKAKKPRRTGLFHGVFWWLFV